MSLQIARLVAYSSLTTTQVQMSVTSSNIANADTDGYTRKTADQTSLVSAGIGTGTTITGISGTVDKLLLKSLVSATSELGAAKTTADYSDRLQSLFGGTIGGDDGGTSLGNSIASLETALAALAETPESDTLQSQVVSALDAVATQLRETSAGIQSLRSDADQSIADQVDDVNTRLGTIDALNEAIVKATALGRSTADLEDERNTALQELSSLIGVSYYVNDNNEMRIYTSGGQTLLDTEVHAIAYAAASTVLADTVFGAVTVDGVDVTATIESGSIGALIALRDETLPAAQDELDELATALADALDAVHNSGTSLPAPSSLTGTSTVAAGDAFAGTGTVRFAVVDADGELVSATDLDLSSYATVGDLVAAIDAIGGVSASIDADGHVVVTADQADQGVAIGETSTAVGTDGQGLSDWLGLNDLVTGTGAADFAVRADVLAAPTRLATASLDTTTTTVGDAVLSAGSATVAEALADALTGKTSFAAAGGLGATTATFADYAAAIVADVAATASAAETAYTTEETTRATLADTLSSQSGVNLDEETARLSELENLYTAAAQLLSTLNDMFDTLLETVR